MKKPTTSAYVCIYTRNGSPLPRDVYDEIVRKTEEIVKTHRNGSLLMSTKYE